MMRGSGGTIPLGGGGGGGGGPGTGTYMRYLHEKLSIQLSKSGYALQQYACAGSDASTLLLSLYYRTKNSAQNGGSANPMFKDL